LQNNVAIKKKNLINELATACKLWMCISLASNIRFLISNPNSDMYC